MALAGFLVQDCVYRCCTYAHRYTFSVSMVWNSNSQYSYEKSNPVRRMWRRMKGSDLEKRALYWGWGELVYFLALSQTFPLADSFERYLKRIICSLLSGGGQGCPWSLLLFLCVFCWGLGPAVTLWDVSHQAFLRPSEKLCSCWKSVGTNHLTFGFAFENVSLLFSHVLQLQNEDSLQQSSLDLNAELQ